MNARQMYNWMKAKGCMYSDAMIRQKIHETGSIKRWEILSENDPRFQNPFEILYNRIEHRFMDKDFNTVLFYSTETDINRRWVIAEETPIEQVRTEEQVPVVNIGTEPEYFTDAEMERIAIACDRYSIKNSILSYSHSNRDNSTASQIYNTVGILKDGENDNSPTVGFELETNKERLRTGTPAQNYINALDERLGHFEYDGSISGVEFDSHVFTWNKLKKCKPLFKKMFQEMSELGLVADDGCGLHIHIGRNAFAGADAMRRFYFLINSRAMRATWEKIARRNQTGYCEYQDLSTTLAAVKTSMAHIEHGVAVNLEHPQTVEIRIFRSTMSSEQIWSCIELMLNLLDFANSDKATLDFSDVSKGHYAKKYLESLDIRTINSQDLSFLKSMSREECIAKMQECLRRGDIEGSLRYAQQLQAQEA